MWGNIVYSRTDAKAWQTGIVTISKQFLGLQTGLLALPENFKGVSFGFANWNKESFTGVSFAALASWNEGDVTGIQFGFLNIAKSVSGLQFGFINITENMNGIQIGLVNFIKTGKLPVMIIANAKF